MSGNKAVIDGVLQAVSPSQVTTYQQCEAKWFFEKVLGMRTPATQAQARGEQVHKQMEEFYLEAKEPANESAQLLVANHVGHQLPLPGEGLLIEHPHDYALGLRVADVPMRGRIDLLDPRDNQRIHIIDFKTTSNLRYTKTPVELAENTQLVTYGKYAFETYKDAGEVLLTHAYMLTKGKPAAKIVSTEPLLRSDIDAAYCAIESTVERMKDTATRTLTQVDPTWREKWMPEEDDSPCDAFGGCPFRAQCPYATPARKPWSMPAADVTSFFDGALTPEQSMALDEKIKQRKVAQGINPPDAAPPSPTPPPELGATSSTGPGGFQLYIDCFPTWAKESGKTTVSLEEYTASLERKVCEERAVQDVRLIEYGKGKGYLAAAAKANPPTAQVVYGKSGDLTSTVAEALIPLAALVVRGF